MDLGLIFTTAFSLFLLMDPIGNVPIFIAVLKSIDTKRQKQIIIRELLIALFTICLFALMGDSILNLLDISKPTIQISGGIILFLISLKLIFPPTEEQKKSKVDLKKEPLIVPLAIPLVAGPAVLASVIIYSSELPSNFYNLAAIFVAWLASTVILIFSGSISRILGERGIAACERLMGLILTMISVEMFLQGIKNFSTNL